MGDKVKSEVVYAKDMSCIECSEPAVAFWPMIDPDIPHHPYCRKCLDKVKTKALINMIKNAENYNNNLKP